MEIFLSICVGIGLSAACGFRVFVPLFCLSVAAHFGADHVHLAKSFEWVASYPAMIAFGAATVAEIIAYYIPWVDNALDSVAIPLATIAGIFVTGSIVADLDPFWRWTLAIIAGGGAAATTQLATTKVRAASSMTTGGVANPVLSTFENISSSILSALAVLWPIVAFILAVVALVLCWILIWFVGKRVLKFFQQKSVPSGVTA